MFALIWPLLIYWLVMFVACYVVVEVGQDQFYDAVTPNSGYKVAGGSFLLAALLTWLRPTYDTMFTADIAWTVLQALVWFAVFMFIFQFHPAHAAMLGPLTLALVAGLATMGVESLTKSSATVARSRPVVISKPVRQSLNAVPTPPKQSTPAPK